MEHTQNVNEPQSTPTESPLISALSELTGSLLKLAQERIIERIEETAQKITYNIVVTLTVIFLGLIGFVFILTGLAMWIGSISGFGTWFGLLIIGIIVFILALLIGLFQKKK
jgi:hypothetical protein